MPTPQLLRLPREVLTKHATSAKYSIVPATQNTPGHHLKFYPATVVATSLREAREALKATNQKMTAPLVDFVGSSGVWPILWHDIQVWGMADR